MTLHCFEWKVADLTNHSESISCKLIESSHLHIKVGWSLWIPSVSLSLSLHFYWINVHSFIHPFTHSFILYVTSLCARHCANSWEQIGEHASKVPCPQDTGNYTGNKSIITSNKVQSDKSYMYKNTQKCMFLYFPTIRTHRYPSAACSQVQFCDPQG